MPFFGYALKQKTSLGRSSKQFSSLETGRSIAQNMDRLAMDNEHSTRDEETRRQLPIGMTENMLQGLELLSLNLLGTVAGLDDQPIQSFHNRHCGQTTTAVLSDVGKGLVGIVAKPVGSLA
ncbi:unnamed protein product, partial [Didymodactylos carnosus]